MKNMLAIFLVLGIFLFAGTVSAQIGDLITESGTEGFFGVGARSMGMGGAHIAAVLDGTALIYNPAALARIRRIELLTSISHQNLDNSSDPNMLGTSLAGLNNRGQNNTRLNGINLSVPYPTYRGSLVLAFGLNRVKSFDKSFSIGYDDIHTLPQRVVQGTERESGSLYALSAGAGIDISPKISLGGTLNYYFGTDDYNWLLVSDFDDEEQLIYNDNIKDDYSAVSAKLGFLLAPSQNVKFGATIETPIDYDIEEKYTLRSKDRGSSTYDIVSGKYDYNLLAPFSIGSGIAVTVGYMQFAADINYTDWTQLEYRDDPSLESENVYIQDYYRDVFGFSIGGELLIPKVGAKLRAGYRYDPLPYRDTEVILGPDENFGIDIFDDRQFITFGIGYLIDRVMTLDIAFVLGGYKIMDNQSSIIEDYDLSRIYVSTGFRL
jgi:long-chain fatty acid transport protein